MYKRQDLSKTYFVIWTTTTWTLPANDAICVGPNFTYSLVKWEDEYYVDVYKRQVSALGALLNYLKDTQRKVPLKINRIENYTQAQFMGIDLNTRRNLELLETMRNKEKRGSLL